MKSFHQFNEDLRKLQSDLDALRDASEKRKKAKSFKQHEIEKMGEKSQHTADVITHHREKNQNRVTHTKSDSGTSDLHRPFYAASKSAVKGTVKGALKLAKKVMQRDN